MQTFNTTGNKAIQPERVTSPKKGAKPRAKRPVTPEQFEAREARRVERLRKSFERVTVKAKSDIEKAIKKGKPAYDIESRVPEREACYRQLRSLKALKEDERAASVVMPLWDGFLNWASSEKLDITVQPRGIGHGDASRWYMCIKAEPARTTPLRRKARGTRAVGWQ